MASWRRGPRYLDGDAWEALFDASYVPTLLLVPMAPRWEAANNDLVRTVVVPGAGHFFHGQLTLLRSILVGAWH